ncbi:MAG: hypothetical protein DDT37_01226 [Firmicutes bacterium]|nr:hypothetical protein [candidate division NPL-UPA2 bacterium]
MKRALMLILCVALLVGCRQPPPPPASEVELVRAVAVVGGKEYVLYPASTGGIRLPSIDGEVVFEYSGPVEVDADSSIIAVSGSTVRTILIGSSQVAQNRSKRDGAFCFTKGRLHWK